MSANDSSFWKYKVHADGRGVSSRLRRKMRVRLLTAPIVGDLSGYFFGTSEISPTILYDDMLSLD